MKKTKIGYICATDFDWELEELIGGENDTYPRIYPTMEEAQRRRHCLNPKVARYCGIYKVEITVLEQVQKEDRRL